MAAKQWSKERCRGDFLELQASAMSLVKAGQQPSSHLSVLIGGKKCLALIAKTSDDEFRIEAKIANSINGEINKISFNEKANLSAAAIADKITFVKIAECELTLTNIQDEPGGGYGGYGHSRVISDLDWKDEVLASTSADGQVNLWDTRVMKKSLALNTLTASSKVRFGRSEEFRLITAHDEGSLKLWDIRSSKTPVKYLAAHSAKVLSVDFSDKVNHVVSSGQDRRVKVFNLDIIEEENPVCALKTGIPVWKARYAPFGAGLATVALPQLDRKENSLFLWNLNKLDYPVHCFYGHDDVILDIDWVKNAQGEFEMITFGRDQTLRIWDVPSALRTECGEINDADNASKDPKEETGEPEGGGGASGSRDSTPTAKKREWNLQGEFQSINLSHFKYLELDSFNSSRRSCYVTASFMGRPRKMYHLALVITFPCGYPDNAAPIFAFSKGNSLETNQKNFILKSLKSTAKQRVRRQLPSLEPCLKQLEAILDRVQQSGDSSSASNSPSFDLAEHVRAATAADTREFLLDGSSAFFRDCNVPFPRNCGARFCGNDRLVCFGTRKINEPNFNTPRAYSSFVNPKIFYGSSDYTNTVHARSSSSPFKSFIDGGGGSNPGSHYNTITGSGVLNESAVAKRKGRFKVRKVKSGSGERLSSCSSEKSSTNSITKAHSKLFVRIYDVSSVQPFARDLAATYHLGFFEKCFAGGRSEACVANAAMAAKCGRNRLANLWNTCAKIAQLAPECVDHPLGRPLLESVIKVLLDQGDFQTAAVIICIFRVRKKKSRGKISAVCDNYSVPEVVKEIGAKNQVEDESKREQDKTASFWFLRPGAMPANFENSPYHTVHSSEQVSRRRRRQRQQQRLPPILQELQMEKQSKAQSQGPEQFVTPYVRASRSNSWSESYDEAPPEQADDAAGGDEPEGDPDDGEHPDDGFLDPNNNRRNESVTHFYSNVLLNWRMEREKTAVFKLSSDRDGASFPCSVCGSKTTCKTRNCRLRCGVCQIPVRGLASFCSKCGHGGHMDHIKRWFLEANRNICPTGCGCKCQEIH